MHTVPDCFPRGRARAAGEKPQRTEASGLPVVQVSQQLGHSTEMLLSTYAHVISEYANAPKVVPEEEIWAARAGCC